jgi:mannitol-1-phosphate 5-dehydrogenase
MALTGRRTYVGFGFGAIQAGLFLYEAYGSGAFRRLVVAEVAPGAVAAVRRAEGRFSVNTAYSDQVRHSKVGPVEIEDPASEPDRNRLVEAIAEAAEIGTAIPSVGHYVSAGPGSLHRVLAEGLRKKAACRGPRAIVYTAENHNRAAEILESKVLSEIPVGEREAVHSRVQFLNTVIAKMSGVISDPDEIRTQELITITPDEPRAFLVEAFNRILISKVQFGELDGEPPFQRGIAVFEEKENLLHFEEAKFYGHNAAHALAAYLGAVTGVHRIADLRKIPGVLPFLRAALIEESGAALVRRYAGVGPLFTTEGYQGHADDLLRRMLNPHLLDTVERVGRDPERKLGWDDRLIGTIRMALREGVKPRRYAIGVSAALARIDRSALEKDMSTAAVLSAIWSDASPTTHERGAVLGLVEEGRQQLVRWIEAGFPDLERFFGNG